MNHKHYYLPVAGKKVTVLARKKSQLIYDGQLELSLVEKNPFLIQVKRKGFNKKRLLGLKFLFSCDITPPLPKKKKKNKPSNKLDSICHPLRAINLVRLFFYIQ